MSEQNLLELAAKAAGYMVAFEATEAWMSSPKRGWWNPMKDDGDALRLALDLSLDIYCDENAAIAVGEYSATEPHNGDRYAAVRRAIVRAAAEIGKAMQ